LALKRAVMLDLGVLVRTFFFFSSLWKHLIALLVKEQTNLSAIFDCSRCGSDCVDSLLLSLAVKAKKSVTTLEGLKCLQGAKVRNWTPIQIN
jgi:hypothetical protein